MIIPIQKVSLPLSVCNLHRKISWLIMNILFRQFGIKVILRKRGTSLLVSTDLSFLYREDRIPLPVVMMRQKESGLTFTLVHKDSKCETVLNDSRGVEVDEGYQFGGV